MATNYPSSLDTFDTIASDKKTSDTVGGRTHRDMHNDLADAVEAVQAELGTDPAGAYATVKARLDALVSYGAKTSAYTATAADHTLNVTSGTFTLDLPAASTVTGQSLRVKNSGTGVVTLDGNSSETVEGVATFPLGPGSYVEITSTGSAWILTGGTPDTGWRKVTLANSWAGGDHGIYVRRVGTVVHVIGRDIDGASATAFECYTFTTGFTAPSSIGVLAFPVAKAAGVTFSGYATLSFGDLAIGVGDSGYTAARFNASWATTDAWPTSLPGSAV